MRVCGVMPSKTTTCVARVQQASHTIYILMALLPIDSNQRWANHSSFSPPNERNMPTKYQITIYGSVVAAMTGTIIVSLLVFANRGLRRQLLFRVNSFDPKTVEMRQNIYSHVGDPSSMPPPSSLSLSSSTTSIAGYGYINLSCPYEMSKYSCAYMMTRAVDDDGGDDTNKAAYTLDASKNYYSRNIDMIQSTFRLAAKQRQEHRPRRVFFTGDSLMRQLFIAIACNAMSSLPQWGDLIDHAVFPWKDEWKCGSNNGPCLIMGGQHSGFDSASIMLTNNLEIHFVPHMGYVDDDTAEHGVLERLRQDIIDRNGRITFGTKTAVPMSPYAHVDVLVYNVGMYFCTNRMLRQFFSCSHQSSLPSLSSAGYFAFADTSRLTLSTLL